MNSKAYHKKYLHHRGSGILESFREVIFGLEDGLVSTLGVVIGIAAATQDVRTVIISGLVVIFVEAISMGAGTYLSTKSEKELRQHFLNEEAEEIASQPDNEKKEAREYLVKLGYTDKEIPLMLKRITSDKQMWLNFMAVNELGFVPEEGGFKLPWADTIYMWISYVIGGSVSLLAFIFFPLDIAPLVAVIFVAIALLILGGVKGKILRVSWIISGLEMLFIGLLAAGVGQLVGYLADKYLLK